MPIFELLFWVCVGLVAYGYIGYPLILGLVSLLTSRTLKRRQTPTVSLVICAYNEADVISRKLENCLALDYPEEQLEIIVASDGSTDGTDEAVERFASRGVRLLRPFAERRGKAEMLNEAIRQSTGGIVVLSDARQTFERDALLELVANFADPTIGAVSGELHLDSASSTAVSEGVSLYWRYEKTIRKLESKVDSVVGATGAIYAIRRKLFRPLPPQTTLDDVAIPMRIVMQGYRVAFEPNAKAHDRAASTSSEEWRRKVRTLAGNYQLVALMPQLLNPFRNRVFFQFVSHKILCRLLVPFALIGALVSNLFLLSGFYRFTLLAQLAFYALGTLGLLLESRTGHLRFLALPNTLILLNASAVVGLIHYLTVQPMAVWKKAGSRDARGSGS